MAKTVHTTPELELNWTLEKDELQFVTLGRYEPTKLGSAILFKHFQCHGRFPEAKSEIAPEVCRFLAQQLRVAVETWDGYDLQGRTASDDRQRTRRYLGYTQTSKADRQALAKWLRQNTPLFEDDPERTIDIAFDRLRHLSKEPPAYGTVERIARGAAASAERRFCKKIWKRIPDASVPRLEAFLAPISKLPKEIRDEFLDDDSPEDKDDGLPRAVVHYLKAGPGAASLKSIKHEADKLSRVRGANLPSNLFDDVAEKALIRMKLRVGVEETFELKRHPEEIRLTLLAAFCAVRQKQIIDNLVDILTAIIHKMGVNAETKVNKNLTGDFKKVFGTLKCVYNIGIATRERPTDQAQHVVYDAVPKAFFDRVIAQVEAGGGTYEAMVRSIVLRSYGGHYRAMLPILLESLTFRTNGAKYKAALAGLEIVKKHLHSKATYFPDKEDVPIEGVVDDEWLALAQVELETGDSRIHRKVYEMALLQTLREGLRSREVWVEGALRYRDPDEDLPKDFEARRDHYYELLGLPRDAKAYLAPLKEAQANALREFDQGILKNKWVAIVENNDGWIKLTPLDPQPEPENILALKAELNRRYNQTNLLDIFSEADHRVGFVKMLKSPTKREVLPFKERRRRQLLTLYSLGTNIPIKSMCNDESSPEYKALLYTRRRDIHAEGLREAIRLVVNATIKAKLDWIWGRANAFAADSKKFPVFQQNMRAEFHNRLHGRGVMIYWHVDGKALCIFSQMKTCSSSEVASMIEGVVRHGTGVEVEDQYVDTHGQNEVAFGICRMLGFNLRPRLKGIHLKKLYKPDKAMRFKNIGSVVRGSIDWALIERNYDQMVKHVVALRVGTASSEAIMSRFIRKNNDSEVYKAFVELGRVEKTTYLCHYLHSLELRQEVNAGLNVVENWNSANDHIFFGRGREFSSNRPDDQEESMLSLHLLQSCLVYVNTLMIQQLLVEAEWRARFSKEDYRALTPMMYAHINAYGLYILDPDKRLEIEREAA